MNREACQGKRVKQPDRADVFSFGIMLWSILTEQRPFDDGESRNRDISRKVSLVVVTGEARARLFDTHCWVGFFPQIISGERPGIPDSCPPGFKALLQDCWHKQPSKRPSMTQVRRQERESVVAYSLHANTLPCLHQVHQRLVALQSEFYQVVGAGAGAES